MVDEEKMIFGKDGRLRSVPVEDQEISEENVIESLNFPDDIKNIVSGDRQKLLLFLFVLRYNLRVSEPWDFKEIPAKCPFRAANKELQGVFKYIFHEGLRDFYNLVLQACFFTSKKLGGNFDHAQYKKDIEDLGKHFEIEPKLEPMKRDKNYCEDNIDYFKSAAKAFHKFLYINSIFEASMRTNKVEDVIFKQAHLTGLEFLRDIYYGKAAYRF